MLQVNNINVYYGKIHAVKLGRCWKIPRDAVLELLYDEL